MENRKWHQTAVVHNPEVRWANGIRRALGNVASEGRWVGINLFWVPSKV